MTVMMVPRIETNRPLLALECASALTLTHSPAFHGLLMVRFLMRADDHDS